jgi:glucose/arabinose dehydrogenase
MRRPLSILAVLLAILAWAPAAASHPAEGGRSQAAASPRITAKRVATGLAFPAAFTFANNGRIFYGERFSGWVRVLDPKTHRNRRFFRIPRISGDGEEGLLGIALAPGYPDPGYVYVFATRAVHGSKINQIIRITSRNGKGVSMRVIFQSNTQSGSYHDGGHIAFGPDGMLYTVIGESHRAGYSQNLTASGGKVLRMTPTGAVPQGNPMGSRVYAYGIRNSFGFDFDPSTGAMWESENGPSCNDELNRIVSGGNYGWGSHETCETPPRAPRNTNQDGPNPILPLRWYSPTIAPTGLAFCKRCGLGTASEGTLFFGAYNSGSIRRVQLTSDRTGVASQAIVYHHGSGILSMETAPGGRLYFSDGESIFRLRLGTS